MSFMKYSAKMLLLAFQVQRKSILNFCAEGFIGKLNDSLARLAQNSASGQSIMLAILPG
jgi:hypothetical protein